MQYILLDINSLIEIDWRSFILGTENWNFLIEVALRTLVMFLVILFTLRILGKRSISQLSVFELGVIIGLGSAAGDPMFYKEVGVLPGVIVFGVVIMLYRLMTFLINHIDNLEKFLEGSAVYVAEEGKFNYENFQKEPIAHEEFFAQLRQHNISHLGQLKLAIIESNGAISLYYYPDDEVRWGLPILPHLYADKLKQIPAPGKYACSYCGTVEEPEGSLEHLICPVCSKNEWVKAAKYKRIT